MGWPKSGDERRFAGDADPSPSKPREASAAAEPDWTSLHPDITNLVAERLLDDDFTEYMRFRLVCSHWRASTADPRDAATLADRRFHPRGWVALCDGDGVRPVEDAAITFFHTATSRIRRISLPELRGQRIVGITDGLLILLDTRAAVIRVLHPFTRAAVDLPHLATFVFVRCVLCKQKSFSMDSVAWMNASVCVAGPGSIAVVIWLPNMPMVICAQTGSRSMGWKIIHTRVQFSNTLPFNGGLYGVTRVGRQIVRVYPPHAANPVVAEVPKELGHPEWCFYFLVESMGAMLVAVLHKPVDAPLSCALFRVDLPRRELTPVTSLGHQALFISRDRCLSVSSMDQPSITGNSVYFARPGEHPVQVYSLDDGSFESTLTPQQSQDIVKGVLPASVRPFTLAHHLATYCRHREWTRGLMFHDHCYMRPNWTELWQRVAAQDAEVTIPRLRVAESVLKKLELPDLLRPARTLSQALAAVLTP